MSKTITIIPTIPKPEKKKRVAAYARVSSGKDAMLHSLSAQISYYSGFIQSHGDWLYCGVYSDEAKTGTKDSREGFQRLIADCREGKLDLLITKSISRFARNTVTLLQTVRELKSLGVDVFFEEQGIRTMSGDGELMMTILASYAQEESLSASENQKWRIKRSFEEGKPWSGRMLGYRRVNGKFTIVPEEADIVKLIFERYLGGLGCEAIAKKLNNEGSLTRRRFRWDPVPIMKILKNRSYTGNLLLQKTYRENHITKKKLVNQGELPMYYAEKTHEAIINEELFKAVQAEIAARAEKFGKKTDSDMVYPFTKLLVCGICGRRYRRKTTHGGVTWVCPTYNTLGKSACASKQIPETILAEMTAEVLGTPDFDADTPRDSFSSIRVERDNTLVYVFSDGSEVTKQWRDRSRAESWTDEMKEAARRKTLERRQKPWQQ